VNDDFIVLDLHSIGPYMTQLQNNVSFSMDISSKDPEDWGTPTQIPTSTINSNDYVQNLAKNSTSAYSLVKLGFGYETA
jgi:hypothetical protein